MLLWGKVNITVVFLHARDIARRFVLTSTPGMWL